MQVVSKKNSSKVIQTSVPIIAPIIIPIFFIGLVVFNSYNFDPITHEKIITDRRVKSFQSRCKWYWFLEPNASMIDFFSTGH